MGIRSLVLIVLLGLAPMPLSRADEDDLRARVATLLEQAAKPDTSESEDSFEALRKLGWAKVRPHLDMRRHDKWEMWNAILTVVELMGEGDGFYELCVQAMRTGNEDIALSGIQLLLDAFSGEGVYDRPDFKPPAWKPAYWRELLIEFHKTEVVVLENFYSGPGFPSWNLNDLLTLQVEGREHELLALLGDEDWRVRMMVAPFLSATVTGRTDAVVAGLLTLLSDKNARVRRMAVRAVGFSGWVPLAEEVSRAMLDPKQDVDVRVEAASCLSQMEWAGLEAAYLAALEDANPLVRAAAGSAAPYLPKTVALCGALLRLLDDPDARVRAGAAGGLWYQSLPRGTRVDPAVLLRRVSDPAVAVRRTALRLLTEQRAVPASLLPLLIERLTGDERVEVREAIQALGSLRGQAKTALEALDAVKDGHLRRDVELAMEAVRMSAYETARLDAQLEAADSALRLAAAREVVRRDDMPRVLRALRALDPEVALEAAWHLAESKKHAAGVVDAVIRAFPVVKGYRCYYTLQRMGADIEPHVGRLMKEYEKTGETNWFGLLSSVPVTRPHLANAVWDAFTRSGTWESVQRVGRLGADLLPRLLERVRTGVGPQRLQAANATRQLPSHVIGDHYMELKRFAEALKEDDAARVALEALLEEKRPSASTPVVELR